MNYEKLSFAEAFQNNTGINVYVGNVNDDFHGNVEVKTNKGKVFVFSGWGGISLASRSIAQYTTESSGVEYKTVCNENAIETCDVINLLINQAYQGVNTQNIGCRPKKKATPRVGKMNI